MDGYRFIGSRGQRVRIDATSTDFDTYLMLTLPDGGQRENDDGPDGTDARMDEVLPADGEYVIRVTSYEPGETGTYRLSLSAGQEFRTPAGRSGGPAGLRGHGRGVGLRRERHPTCPTPTRTPSIWRRSFAVRAS